MQEASTMRRAAIARRVIAGAFVLSIIGALIAFLAGPDVDGPVGTIGAVLVIAGVVIAFVATPIGFVLSIAAMRFRARRALQGVVGVRPSGNGEESRPGDE